MDQDYPTDLGPSVEDQPGDCDRERPDRTTKPITAGLLCVALLGVTGMYFHDQQAVRERAAEVDSLTKPQRQLQVQAQAAEIAWVADMRQKALAAADSCVKRGGSPLFQQMGIVCQETAHK